MEEFSSLKDDPPSGSFQGDSFLKEAIANPAVADWVELWRGVEVILSTLPQEHLLKVAGELLAQLADFFAARAEYLLSEWQTKYDPPNLVLLPEPILTDDMLASVLRHSMTLSLDELLEEPEPQERSGRSPSEGSIVVEVEKEVLLETLEQMKQTALTVAYEENITEWSETVYQWIDSQNKPVVLADVFKALQLAPVRIWLGLLLSEQGYQWEHQWKTAEEFYCSTNILIQPHKKLQCD